MKFVMHRDRVVASKHGHTIAFKKGEATHVPPECHQEVIAAGGVPEGELQDEKKPVGPVMPEDPAEREKAVFDAFENLLLKAQREDFGANGAPHGKALQRELGWVLNNKDRDVYWTKFKSGKED